MASGSNAGKQIKQLGIKGLQTQEIAYKDYLAQIEQEALSEVRREKARARAKAVMARN